MKTVMVVEDEPLMRELIADYMKDQGFHVVEAKNGAEALERFAHIPADAVVLDVMMPYLDGFGVCQFLRQTSDAVIIIVTAKSEETDKLHGYELGADDYVTKPFSPKVLVAKVKALLKRVGNNDEADAVTVHRVEGLEIREQSFELLVDGKQADLTPKEFELLLYLYKNRSRWRSPGSGIPAERASVLPLSGKLCSCTAGSSQSAIWTAVWNSVFRCLG
jgi:DNA-binding response OmpR family regulator